MAREVPMASTMDAVVRKDDVRKYFWFCGNCFVDGLQGICGWAARCPLQKKQVWKEPCVGCPLIQGTVDGAWQCHVREGAIVPMHRSFTRESFRESMVYGSQVGRGDRNKMQLARKHQLGGGRWQAEVEVGG